MNEVPGFDISRDCGLVGLVAFGFFFGGSVLFAMSGPSKRNLAIFQIYLSQLIFVPLAVFLTAWCYQHPEQIDNKPDSWMYDMRILWPIFLIVEGLLVYRFTKISTSNYLAEGIDLLQRANELWSQGQYEEAEDCYAKARWMLDYQNKRR